MRTHSDRDLRMLAARRYASGAPGHREPLDLAGAELEMATIPHIDLTGANLAGANLRGAMLWGALLDDACLDGADLTCADLTWSSLTGCSMKATLLVEADLDEALVDEGFWDAVTVGSSRLTISFTGQALERMVAPRPGAPEEWGRQNQAMLARDEGILRAHQQSAPLSLRRRGAAGFALRQKDPGFTDDWYLYKNTTLDQSRTRVLSDTDLQDLLRWSASTGRPLNLRGCNLSGADLRNASLRGACLAFTNATGADLRGVDLTGANLEDSRGWGTP